MNRDDVIRMAREAGALFDDDDCLDDCAVEIWARFAALVAAEEREACARVCDAVFEESNNYRVQGYANHCAAAIRARGGKK